MENITFNSLLFFIREAKENNKKVLITFHSVGDSDSVASAVALKQYFENAKIITPDYITANATRMLKVAGFKPEEISKGFDENSDIIILVDVNNFEDCGSLNYYLKNFDKDIIIIDHHILHNIEKERVFVYNDENSNSTSSIIYELFKQLKFNTSVNTKYILLYGIISDSADLKNAFPDTFVEIGALLKDTGTNYQSLLSMIEPLVDPKSRLGVVADICNAEKYIIGDVLIFYGQSHTHANVSADISLKAGADLSLFFSIGMEGISFSARLRETLDKRYDIHLGKVMKELAPIIRGSGGGHPCAAGAYGPVITTEKEFKEAFIGIIKKHINK
ncbi:MAG: DHH family phosphoesterase [Candidatus Micrarchaeia archaeon]